MIVNQGTEKEVAVRVVLESDEFGREYFDYGSLDRCLGGLVRVVNKSIKCAGQDGVQRVVGIAIVPRECYGDEAGYYPEFEDDETGTEAHFTEEPLKEGLAALESLANLPA